MRPDTLSPGLRSIAPIAISLALLAGVPAPCASQSIIGTLVTDATGFPVDSAHVVLQSLDRRHSAVGAVDRKGLFRLDAPAAACYRLAVVLPDKVVPTAVFYLAPGDTTSFHLSLAVPGAVAGVAPTFVGGVSGRVVDSADGHPVAGASLTLTGVREAMLTDADGLFHVPAVIPGLHRIAVERAGYVPLAGTVEVLRDRMLEVSVSLEPQATAVDWLLQNGSQGVDGQRRPPVVIPSLVDLEARLLGDLRRMLGGHALGRIRAAPSVPEETDLGEGSCPSSPLRILSGVRGSTT